MLAELLFRPFESLLNRGLVASAEAQSLAVSLEGRSLALNIEGTPIDMRLRVAGGRIRVVLPDGSAPDACLSGGPLGMSRLLGSDPKAAIREGSVRISGDAEIAGQFQELLRLAAPDLERELARYVGEPVAREFAGASRAAARWREEASSDVARRMSQYLQENSRLLPTANEQAAFTQQVDEFVNDIERAAARLRQLEEKW